MNKRDIHIDFLRVLATIAVICVHVSARLVTGIPDVHSILWWSGDIVDALSHWGVPVFVMITGALSFSSNSNLAPIAFYKKRMFRLLPILIFWTVIYLAFRHFTDNTFTPKDALSSIVKGTPEYHLWYLYMLVGLYLSVPFLGLIIPKIDSQSLLFLIASCFSIAAIEALCGSSYETNATFLPSFLPFIGYLLAGHYLMQYQGRLTGRSLLFIFLASACIIAVATYLLFPLIGAKSWAITYNNLNPAVIVMSLSLFLLCAKKLPLKFIPMKQVQRLAPMTLGIYLIHPLWLWVFSVTGLTGFLFLPVVGIFLLTLLIFILSALSIAALTKIQILKKLVT